MKYSEKYPNVLPGETFENILVGSKKDNCAVCGELTQFVDIDFIAPICSDECADKLYFDWVAHSSNMTRDR